MDVERAPKLQGRALESISREMVRLYKVQFGRGPDKSSSNFAGPDALLCTLESSMTVAEKEPRRDGRRSTVEKFERRGRPARDLRQPAILRIWGTTGGTKLSELSRIQIRLDRSAEPNRP